MIILPTLLNFLENYLDPYKIKDFGPNGLQIEGNEKILKVGTAVSASLETIEQAVKEKVDALIVHHGMFWDQDSPLILGAKKRKIEALLRNNISLIAYHLPLDAHKEVGNNWRAAQDFGWSDLAPFGNFEGTDIGVKGKFNPIPLSVFIAELEAYYIHPATVALGGKQMVSSAALVSGDAYRELASAIKERVDCFVTGSFEEPIWSAAFEEGINFCALGHFATERIGVRALAELLEERLNIPSIFIDTHNPF